MNKFGFELLHKNNQKDKFIPTRKVIILHKIFVKLFYGNK